MRDGLLPDPPRRNVDCERGVHLAEDQVMAAAMLLDSYAEAGDPRSSPQERLGAVVVVVVDDARLDLSALVPDPNVVSQVGTWLYFRMIDVRGAAVVDLEDIVSG